MIHTHDQLSANVELRVEAFPSRIRMLAKAYIRNLWLLIYCLCTALRELTSAELSCFCVIGSCWIAEVTPMVRDLIDFISHTTSFSILGILLRGLE